MMAAGAAAAAGFRTTWTDTILSEFSILEARNTVPARVWGRRAPRRRTIWHQVPSYQQPQSGPLAMVSLYHKIGSRAVTMMSLFTFTRFTCTSTHNLHA